VWSLVWSNLAAAVIKSGTLAVIGWSTWRPMMHFRLGECLASCARHVPDGGAQLNLLGQQLDRS